MATLQQKLAKQAYKDVTAVDGKDAAYKKKYGTMALKLPILIRTSGLAQALAFVQARGNEAQQLLLDHLAQALGLADGDQLAARSREEELEAYIYLTDRVMAALVWYKRFAESILKVTPVDASDSGEAA